MSFKLNEYKEIIRKGVIDFDDGQKLNFEFYPNKYTPELEEQVAIAGKQEGGGPILKKWLSSVVKSWDVVDEIEVTDKKTGKPTGEKKLVPIPCDAEGMNYIPLAVLGLILDTVVESVRPGEKTDSVSKSSFA